MNIYVALGNSFYNIPKLFLPTHYISDIMKITFDCSLLSAEYNLREFCWLQQLHTYWYCSTYDKITTFHKGWSWNYSTFVLTFYTYQSLAPLTVMLVLHVVTVPLSAKPTLSSYTGKIETWYRVWEERPSSSTTDSEPGNTTWKQSTA